RSGRRRTTGSPSEPGGTRSAEKRGREHRWALPRERRTVAAGVFGAADRTRPRPRVGTLRHQGRTPQASGSSRPIRCPQSTPDGPSAGRVARCTLTSAPCSAVRTPLRPLRSVAQYPGLAAFTLIGVSASSLAYIAVTMFSAVFEDG